MIFVVRKCSKMLGLVYVSVTWWQAFPFNICGALWWVFKGMRKESERVNKGLAQGYFCSEPSQLLST